MTTTLTDPITSELRTILRTIKLGQLLDTLPERITLAKQHHLPHAEFLELVLADEITRRETTSAARRARAAGLDPNMRLDTWDTTATIRYDQQLWTELTSLRFLDAPHGVLLLGPVGVGKTHLATALGHIAIRRRHSVHMARADKLLKRLKAARLDNSVDAEMRRLAHIHPLILDDFALQPLDPTETTDFYELIVERHRKAATVITSNREPSEWLTMMTDPLLAQFISTPRVGRVGQHGDFRHGQVVNDVLWLGGLGPALGGCPLSVIGDGAGRRGLAVGPPVVTA